MKRGIVVLMALMISASFGFSQAATGATPEPVPVLPEEAREHLLKHVPPSYTGLVQIARIQGTVILAIRIDETGKAKVLRAITGHPMLIQPATDAVNQWKYEPFEADGKPIAVITQVVVTVPDTGSPDVIKHKDPVLRTYWQNKREGEAGLTVGDFDKAQRKLLVARSAVEQRQAAMWQELATTATELGSAAFGQKNPGEAEKLYKEALALYQQHGSSETAEAANVMEFLANLYILQNQASEAEPLLLRAAGIYKKEMAQTLSQPDRAWRARHLASSSYWLVSIGHASHRDDLVRAHCDDVLQNAESLPPERRADANKLCKP